MTIIRVPEARVTACAAEGRVFRTVRARTPTVAWPGAQAAVCKVPNRPGHAATGYPPEALMSCGNSETYSSSDFGFRPLIPDA